jgi:hypothetical protein
MIPIDPLAIIGWKPKCPVDHAIHFLMPLYKGKVLHAW